MMHAAQREARRTARANGFDQDKVYQAMDCGWPEGKMYACWVIMAKRDSALVVYEDEPDTVASTGNHKGRFVRTAPEKESADES